MPATLVRKVTAAVATVLLLALVVPLSVALVPQLLGYPTVVVTTGSMGDAVPIGSLAVLEKRMAPSVRVGDILLVQHGDSVTPVLHRAVSLDREGAATVVRTKGDANATADPQPYTLPPQVPVHVATLPKIGYLVAFSKTPAGWFLLVVLPATLLGALILRAVWAAPERSAAAATAVVGRTAAHYELQLREHAKKLEGFRESLRKAAEAVEQRGAAVSAAERALAARVAALVADEAARQEADAELARSRAMSEALAGRAAELEARERSLKEREAALAAAAAERAHAAEPLERLTADLRERTALAAAAAPAATPAEDAAEHLLFVSTAGGYELVARDGAAPERGELVQVEANGRTHAFTVARVGRSPYPADRRRCAYLQATPTAIGATAAAV